MIDLVPGLREAARMLRDGATLLRSKDFGETARTLESEARRVDARAAQEEADSEKDPTVPRAMITCPWCRKDLIP